MVIGRNVAEARVRLLPARCPDFLTPIGLRGSAHGVPNGPPIRDAMLYGAVGEGRLVVGDQLVGGLFRVAEFKAGVAEFKAVGAKFKAVGAEF